MKKAHCSVTRPHAKICRDAQALFDIPNMTIGYIQVEVMHHRELHLAYILHDSLIAAVEKDEKIA